MTSFLCQTNDKLKKIKFQNTKDEIHFFENKITELL